MVADPQGSPFRLNSHSLRPSPGSRSPDVQASKSKGIYQGNSCGDSAVPIPDARPRPLNGRKPKTPKLFCSLIFIACLCRRRRRGTLGAGGSRRSYSLYWISSWERLPSGTRSKKTDTITLSRGKSSKSNIALGKSKKTKPVHDVGHAYSQSNINSSIPRLLESCS